jgi:hypothetical protein
MVELVLGEGVEHVHHCGEHGPFVMRSGPATLRSSRERRQ